MGGSGESSGSERVGGGRNYLAGRHAVGLKSRRFFVVLCSMREGKISADAMVKATSKQIASSMSVAVAVCL